MTSLTNNVHWTRSPCRKRRTGYRQRLRQLLENRPVRSMTESRLRCVKALRGFIQSLEVNPGIILQLNLDRPCFQTISSSFHSRVCIDAISTDIQTALSEKKLLFPLNSYRGTAVAQWLRCCATNRKVAGSISASVNGFFIDTKSFRSHYGPEVDSASNRNEY